MGYGRVKAKGWGLFLDLQDLRSTVAKEYSFGRIRGVLVILFAIYFHPVTTLLSANGVP